MAVSIPYVQSGASIVNSNFLCRSSMTSSSRVEFGGTRCVAARDDVTGLADDLGGDVAHLADGRLQLLRDGAGWELAARQLRHVDGEVAAAFQVGRDAKTGGERAQVAGDRLLPGDQVNGAALDAFADARRQSRRRRSRSRRC